MARTQATKEEKRGVRTSVCAAQFLFVSVFLVVENFREQNGQIFCKISSFCFSTLLQKVFFVFQHDILGYTKIYDITIILTFYGKKGSKKTLCDLH